MARSTVPSLDPTLTPWSALSHKAILRADRRGLHLPPGWLPADERTRIDAYYVRACYLENSARNLLASKSEAEKLEHREYGDARLIVERYKAAVLGDGWGLQVVGAGDDLPEMPELPALPRVDEDEIAELPEEVRDQIRTVLTAAVGAAREVAIAEWREAVEAWEAALAARPELVARQAALDRWVEREGIRTAIDELEFDAAGLGDGVLVLWPQEGDWPTVQIMDPASYFPVEDPDDEGGFGRKHHFAWEETHEEGGREVKKLRRLTFELVQIVDVRTTVVRGERRWADDDGLPVDGPTLADDERIDGDHITRLYPWDNWGDAPAAGPDGRRSRWTCIYSDGLWDTDKLGGDANALDEANATWRAYRHDLHQDFIPIIHAPNTPTGKHRWGRAIIDTVAQVLDDVADADTGTSHAAQYIKHPTVFAPGVTASETMMPGRIIGGPANGRMDVLDLAGGLEKLMAHGDRLRDVAATNSRITKEALGRGVDNGQESGFARLLRLAPFAQIVGAARMVRDPGRALFGRMAQRMAQVQGALEPGRTPDTHMVWGSFLPVDLAQVVEMVTAAVQAHVMSTQTAVELLVGAGMPVDDARAEVDRVVAENVDAADTLADALAGHPDLLRIVAERLGVEPPPDDEAAGEGGAVTDDGPPEIDLPE